MKITMFWCILALSDLEGKTIDIKDKIERRICRNTIELNKNYPQDLHMFFLGKEKAYFELLDMIEEMEEEENGT